jgi:hypothetical protein
MSTATDIIAVTLSAGSLAVSGWAAATAHRARQWQLRRDAERRETRVRVEFLHSTGPPPGRSRYEPDPAPTIYTVTLIAVNDGESIEYLAAAFIHPAVPEGMPHPALRIFGSEGHEDTGAYELRPRARMTVPVDLSAEEIDWMRPSGFVAEAWLASGTVVRSEVERLDETLLRDVT